MSHCARNFVGLGSNQFLVKVQKGHVGTLRIHVPWKALTTEPITIELHDVYVLLTEDQHSERRHIAEEIKRTKLAVWDCIARWQSQQSGATSQPGSLLSLDRVQVKIHSLHIRYEDESADPGHPFAVGVCVDHLVVSPLTPHAEPHLSSHPRDKRDAGPGAGAGAGAGAEAGAGAGAGGRGGELELELELELEVREVEVEVEVRDRENHLVVRVGGMTNLCRLAGIISRGVTGLMTGFSPLTILCGNPG